MIDATSLAIAAPVVVLVGVDKGGFAGAFGPLAVPLMALAMPPLEAAGILLPILLVMDAYGLWVYRGSWDGQNLRALVAGGILGTVISWLFVGHITEATMRVVLGAIALFFVLLNSGAMLVGTRISSPHGKFFGAACGALAGVGSFVAHAGGPPLQMYLLSRGLEGRTYVGTSVVFFAFLNTLKIAPYAALGFLDANSIGTSLVLSPLGPLGIALGRFMVDRVPNRSLRRIALLLLAVAGVKLMWDGLST
jgi:uncharacterized membrane protein YfcA